MKTKHYFLLVLAIIGTMSCSEKKIVPEILGVQIQGDFENITQQLCQRSGANASKYVDDYGTIYTTWEGTYNNFAADFSVHKKADSKEVDYVCIELGWLDENITIYDKIKNDFIRQYGNPCDVKETKTGYNVYDYWKIGNGYISIVTMSGCGMFSSELLMIEASPN